MVLPLASLALIARISVSVLAAVTAQSHATANYDAHWLLTARRLDSVVVVAAAAAVVAVVADTATDTLFAAALIHALLIQMTCLPGIVAATLVACKAEVEAVILVASATAALTAENPAVAFATAILIASAIVVSNAHKPVVVRLHLIGLNVAVVAVAVAVVDWTKIAYPEKEHQSHQAHWPLLQPGHVVLNSLFPLPIWQHLVLLP
mmetsp:Transcript_11670/g.21820  ORF Transcript_11670/g.21820 Transcript_11670/m.21820 type:complete len:206 (-) Transcript_11670:953-1570(-)